MPVGFHPVFHPFFGGEARMGSVLTTVLCPFLSLTHVQGSTMMVAVALFSVLLSRTEEMEREGT